MTDLVNFVKFIFFILFLASPSLIYAHAGEDDGPITHTGGQYDRILPFYYIDHGEWGAVIFVCVFWIVILYGIYSLFMMILGPHLKH